MVGYLCGLDHIKCNSAIFFWSSFCFPFNRWCIIHCFHIIFKIAFWPLQNLHLLLVSALLSSSLILLSYLSTSSLPLLCLFITYAWSMLCCASICLVYFVLCLYGGDFFNVCWWIFCFGDWWTVFHFYCRSSEIEGYSSNSMIDECIIKHSPSGGRFSNCKNLVAVSLGLGVRISNWSWSRAHGYHDTPIYLFHPCSSSLSRSLFPLSNEWVDSNSCKKREAMKIDACHVTFELIQTAQNEDWNDSEEVRHILWYDSYFWRGFNMNRFMNTMNRLTPSQKLFVIRFRHMWVDSCRVETYFDRYYVIFLRHTCLGALTNSKCTTIKQTTCYANNY